MKRLLLSAALSLGSAFAGGNEPGPVTQALTLDFGGQATHAELLRPDGKGAAPLVLLVQGTGPEDLNGSFQSYGGRVQGSLGTLAQTLVRQGFAVMRFDKRYAAATFDPKTAQAAQESYAKLTMKDLLADAGTALETAKKQPGIDAKQVFIYGWSEGSVVAASLAQAVGAQGLIVQGPVVNSFADAFTRQFERVGLAYLKPYAPDGKINLKGVVASLYGPGSALARTQGQFLLARDSTPDVPKLAAVLDTNGDGGIDLRAEALPMVRAFYAQSVTQSPLYAPATTLPTLGELAPTLKIPVLILQGENDGNIDPASTRQLNSALAAAGNTNHTLKLYPGLGHSLGPAKDLTLDDFAPMARGPMNDMAAWLRAKVR
ncbi:alpha/beta hydrolase family protein [Deinococcus marmoris]|uniref:Hydrolase, alpha/beta fold family n=1 Tax=Deinococcus marmoris TaxID=249408 RepID=A0A1U7P074_9DEIO|nr:alpha/beta hydrolase [Deinococcus marmoris]OLV18572.1 hydrolase, alpha/beta fold family [Deinococcus marmoris]